MITQAKNFKIDKNKSKQGDRITTRRASLQKDGIEESDENLFGELLRKGYDDYFEPKKDCKPTAYPPGSIGKMVILSLRLIGGEKLYHADDAKIVATIEEQTALATFVKDLIKDRKSSAISVGP